MNNIITQNHISELDTEILWNEKSNIQDGLDGMQIKFSTTLKLSNGTLIKVFFDKEEYFELLGEKFELIGNQTNENVVGTLFFSSDKLNTALGSIDNNGREALAIGDGFGILKSAISGLGTLWGLSTKDSLPIHGSALDSSDTGGIMLVAGHGGGKTTGLLNITDLLGTREVVSDDWLIGDFSNNGLNVTTTDNSISLSQKSLRENTHITQINSEQMIADLSKRKKSYKPEELLGNSVKKHEHPIDIKTIVLLMSGVKNDISFLTEMDNVPEYILGATYHFPYYNEEIKNKHLLKWREGLKGDKTNVIIFDHSHFDDMMKGYIKLVNTIIKGKK